uniref:Uncharacterized protein n=1 Tax=Anguilla anguilla TaxID=7936 RepID=A0A0E9U5T3_ANGAN
MSINQSLQKHIVWSSRDLYCCPAWRSPL